MSTELLEGSGSLIIATGVAAVLVIGLVLLRTLSDGKAEVKLTDAAIALIPVVVVLFATGTVSKLVVGPGSLTIEGATEAILDAATSDVESQVDLVVPEQLEEGEKADLGRIPEYLSRGVEALTFHVGWQYVGGVIEEYLTQLTTSPQFRYVIVDEGGAFFGIIDARKLLVWAGDNESRWDEFQSWVESNPEMLRELPGFTGVEDALDTGNTKREALQQLEDTDREWLPVVNDYSELAGIVNRNR